MDDYVNETCGSCRFFHEGEIPHGAVALDVERLGACRRLPPTSTRIIDLKTGRVAAEVCDYPHLPPQFPACSQFTAAVDAERNGVLDG